MTTAPPLQATSTFPQREVQDRLRSQLLGMVQQQARMKDETLPAAPAVLTTRVSIDSLAVVEILCVLDEIVPFPVDESVVRAGGYSTIEDALLHLTTQVEKKWRKHHGTN